MSINQINYFGALLGFISINILLYFLSGKFEGDNQSKSIFLNINGNTFHLHNWIIGLIILILVLIFEQIIGRNLFVSIIKGVAIGSIFHGLSFYIDYLKIRR